MRGAVAVLAIAGLAACSGYRGPARPIAPAEVREAGWHRATPVALVSQRGADDCGLAAAAMVLEHHGVAPVDAARERAAPRGGISARALRDRLRAHGLRSFVVEGTLADLEHELAAGRPVVVGTVKRVDRRRGRPHYEVVVAIHPAERRLVTLDPAAGWRQSSYDGFLSEWTPARRTLIVALPPTAGAAARR